MGTTEMDVDGRDCISFTVRGPWAHFRRIDTTTDKPTYRVIPRTTVAGLIAAVLGEPRDSYYDTFSPENSAIAITPTSELNTQAIPMLTVPTAEGDLKSVGGTRRKAVIAPEEIAEGRKRRTFEYIVDPEYRIDLVLADAETAERVADYLTDGKAAYTPYLGKSEYLAEITDVEQTSVEPAPDGEEAVASTVPEEYVVPEPGSRLRMERTPAYMERDDSGRRTTGFVSYAYAPGGETITAPGAPIKKVEDRSVCFL